MELSVYLVPALFILWLIRGLDIDNRRFEQRRREWIVRRAAIDGALGTAGLAYDAREWAFRCNGVLRHPANDDVAKHGTASVEDIDALAAKGASIDAWRR